MSADRPRASALLEVKNRLGLHLRAATLVVQTLAGFQADITVAKDDKSVNGRSILGLATLDAAQGSQVEVTALGPDAEAALLAVRALFEACFHEGG